MSDKQFSKCFACQAGFEPHHSSVESEHGMIIVLDSWIGDVNSQDFSLTEGHDAEEKWCGLLSPGCGFWELLTFEQCRGSDGDHPASHPWFNQHWIQNRIFDLWLVMRKYCFWSVVGWICGWETHRYKRLTVFTEKKSTYKWTYAVQTCVVQKSSVF